jgi:hypothetical protein
MTQENDYQRVLEGRSDEELVEIYLHPEGYNEAFVALLPAELTARRIDVEKLTSDEEAGQALLEKRSDEELRDTYIDVYSSSREERDEAGQELARRGLDPPVEMRQWNEAKLREGAHGNFIELGYVLVFFIGLVSLIIGLDYANSTVRTPDGRFPKYDAATRKAGRNILILLVLVLALAIFLGILAR